MRRVFVKKVTGRSGRPSLAEPGISVPRFPGMIVSCKAYERPSAGSGRLTLRKRMFALDGRNGRMNRRVRIRSLLSGREQEVLSWLHEGKTSWDIAMILNITERTVNYHVGNIMQKLDVSSRVHAVSEAGGRTIGGPGHDDRDI